VEPWRACASCSPWRPRAASPSLAVALDAPAAHAESTEAQVERLAAEAVNAHKGADYHRAVELLQKGTNAMPTFKVLSTVNP
jgi:hypothetical protein